MTRASHRRPGLHWSLGHALPAAVRLREKAEWGLREGVGSQGSTGTQFLFGKMDSSGHGGR